MGSTKTQQLPITTQFFAGLILEMTSELHAGDTLVCTDAAVFRDAL
ncbi:conserved protein of unknown function [Pseudomonas sp. NGC7]